MEWDLMCGESTHSLTSNPALYAEGRVRTQPIHCNDWEHSLGMPGCGGQEVVVPILPDSLLIYTILTLPFNWANIHDTANAKPGRKYKMLTIFITHFIWSLHLKMCTTEGCLLCIVKDLLWCHLYANVHGGVTDTKMNISHGSYVLIVLSQHKDYSSFET